MPIVLGSGAGSQVMSRIAVFMIGGMLTASSLSMLVSVDLYQRSMSMTRGVASGGGL